LTSGWDRSIRNPNALRLDLRERAFYLLSAINAQSDIRPERTGSGFGTSGFWSVAESCIRRNTGTHKMNDIDVLRVRRQLDSILVLSGLLAVVSALHRE